MKKLIQHFENLGIDFIIIPRIGLLFKNEVYSFDIFEEFKERRFTLDATFIINL